MGPFPRGANEAVLNMLEEIGTKENIPQFVNEPGPERFLSFDGLWSPRLQKL
ncbi:MAG: hypothetical protein CM1200mP41_18400 [Gammaproteobacteria bacterium]|nr:MAG: hypothetical protein CM1200mP41_18400 [Gammaproteobacteria bacterium]